MGLRSESDLNDPNTRTNWRRDVRMGFYHNHNGADESAADGGNRSSSDALKAFLATAAEDPDGTLSRPESARYLATEIGRKIYSFMLKPEDEELDISLGLAQVGLDSLMAIELRRWWKAALGLQVSVLEIMGTGSIEALGSLALQQLKGLYLKAEESSK